MDSIYIGNHLFTLFDALAANLFEFESRPFACRRVIVPSWSIKEWIQRQLADRYGIAMGISYFSLEGALREMGVAAAPDLHIVTLKIESLLASGSVDWPATLRGEGKKLQGRRVRAVASELARLFELYSLYGSDELAGWQRTLWDMLYSDGFLHPRQALADAKPSLKGWHLFAFSHLAPPHLDLLCRAASHLYLLSPSHHYMGDQTSDRGAAHLLQRWKEDGATDRSLVEMAALLSDGNRLVANLGKLHREMVSPFEERSDVQELYTDPGRSTLLKSLQSDLLHLEQLASEGEPDNTVEVHACPSVVREIEVLKSRIVGWIREGVKPDEILVMAPDISHYAPYISALFEREGEAIPYQVREGCLPPPGSLQDGFKRLVVLAHSRWEASALLDLIAHPLFAKQMGFEPSDLIQVRDWVDLAKIGWGLDAAHRQRVMETEYGVVAPLPDGSTWDVGLATLLREMAAGTLEMSGCDLLSRLIGLLESLKCDLAPMTDGTRLSTRGWATYLRNLVSSYLSPGLESQLTALRDAERWFADPVAFSSIRSWVDEWTSERSHALHQNVLGGVRFCSMLPMRVVPSRHICLIGLADSAFPRRSPTHPLDHLPCGRAPSLADRDRALFLEALLGVGEKLYISYPSLSPMDSQPEPPSVVVSELLAYFEGGIEVVHHSTLPFSRAHFDGESSLDYQAAVALSGEQQPPHRLAIELFEPATSVVAEPDERIIDITALRTLVRDPLRLCLQGQLGLDLGDLRLTPPLDEEPFQLSSLDLYRWTVAGMKRPVDEVVRDAVQSIAPGPFQTAAANRLRSEIDARLSLLGSKGVGRESWQTVSFVMGIDRPIRYDEGWHLPAIQVGTTTLTGTLLWISPFGLLSFGESGVRDAIKAWPEFLLASALADYPDVGVEPGLLFAKGGSDKRPFSTSYQQLLAGLLAFYDAASCAPCPILPDWVAPLLKGDCDRLRNGWASQQIVSPYVQRAMRASDLPSPEEVIRIWQPVVKGAFGEMVANWFGGGK